jgi:hypothetical protein
MCGLHLFGSVGHIWTWHKIFAVFKWQKDFVTSWASISFPRRALLPQVRCIFMKYNTCRACVVCQCMSEIKCISMYGCMWCMSCSGGNPSAHPIKRVLCPCVSLWIVCTMKLYFNSFHVLRDFSSLEIVHLWCLIISAKLISSSISWVFSTNLFISFINFLKPLPHKLNKTWQINALTLN